MSSLISKTAPDRTLPKFESIVLTEGSDFVVQIAAEAKPGKQSNCLAVNTFSEFAAMLTTISVFCMAFLTDF